MPGSTASVDDQLVLCATCGVEHAAAIEVCAICADERQYVPEGGQRWVTLGELARGGEETRLSEVEPDLFVLTVTPAVGIGQTTFLLRTPGGSLLWDPPGYVDEASAGRVLEFGPVIGVAASHPHMFGAQVEWSRALGGVPVLVSGADAGWVQRPDPVIREWSGTEALADGVDLIQLGGHFPGSSVVHWAAGAGGRGVLLVSDTVGVNADRRTVTFLRSFPNRIPLSAAVTQRIADAVAAREFDRIYDNFGHQIRSGAAAAFSGSARRHCGWVNGEFDALT